MSSNLGKQVYIYSISTDVFFNEEERGIKTLKDRYHDLNKLSSQEDEMLIKLSDLHNDLSNVEYEKDKKAIKEKEFIIQKISTAQRQLDYYKWLCEEVFKGKKVSNAGLKRELNSKIMEHKDVRELNPLRLNPTQRIALFKSTLTRKLDIKENELSDKLIIVEIYNYEIFKSLLDKGFKYRGKQYIYFSSSSGQIRDKKAVFIQKDAWSNEDYGVEKSITAGLSVDDINNNGGMSVNKFLAYKSLASSASNEWSSFKIDRCIVVDDVEASLKNRTVDFISRDTFDVIRDEDRTVDLEITDGAGMYLPSLSEELFGEGVYKNMQFRLPFMKGCLSPVPFNKFSANPKVTDIYGKEWDIVKDQVEVIFFKSQFKMWKHFINKNEYKESWKVYQDNFKKYDCEAAFMNAEEDSIPNAKLNYQYLQSLVDVENEDLMNLGQMTNDDLMNMGSDVDTMIRVLGAEDENEEKNEFQHAINLYPALLNDKNSKKAIKNRKEKIIKEAKSGKLSIEGKYTYVLPDWYYVMNSIFLGNEKGLLQDGQVSSSLYENTKVDLMRAPALSFEHVIRENIRSEEMKKWFITKAVHISANDLLPKILMADFDGDKILITSSECLINVVENNAKRLDVVPLEYEMGVSDPKPIDPDSIFESLKVAFKANIGIISNTISKVFNKSEFDYERDYKLIKQLCSYNNHVIDMAKTLDVVTLPENIKAEWNKYEKQKLPYFFMYAKDKKVTMEKNESIVNKLEDVIIDKRIHFKSVIGKFDYKKLMWSPNVKDDEYIIDKETDQKIINKYNYLNKNKRHYMHKECEDNDTNDKKLQVYVEIRKKLLEVYPDSQKIADILVRHLFHFEDTEYKRTLWESFGEDIVDNIRKNVHNEVDCAGCGEIIDEPRQRQIRCDECQKKHRNRQDRERKRKLKEKLEELSA
ncbi:TraR/DksA C4-type zinc finger protein [Salipaludibacillus sp. CF4.18]|uniref:TraR/DksA C4-type zinc finger protein n=1 Tax=Salipaludibacillus sp. CF4.18 TaxID=3373081 RepID=UPI003EE6A6BF